MYHPFSICSTNAPFIEIRTTIYSLLMTILLPIQRSMIRHSAQSIEEGIISKAYRKASRYWGIFGITATLLPVVILYLMITKGF
nr:DUF2269 family protein [Bacillus methanolicus]